MAPSYNQVKYKKIKLRKGRTCIWGPSKRTELKAGRGGTNYKATVYLKEQPILKKRQVATAEGGYRIQIKGGKR